MKKIVLPAYNRPDLLQQTLDSLKENDLGEWAEGGIHFSIEPGQPETVRVAQSVDWIKKEIHINPVKMGVRENPLTSYQRVFSNPEVEAILTLEDDLILSRDALSITSFALTLPNINDFICFNLWCHTSSTEDPTTIVSGGNFSCLGIGITRHQWENHIRPCARLDSRGWDWSAMSYMTNTGIKNINPTLSRIEHIGRDARATHYRSFHDPIYVGKPWYQGDAKRLEYKFQI